MELRDVVRRLKAAQGIRRIHEETGVHRTIIRALRDTAEAQGWLKPGAALPSEEEIQQVRRKEASPEAAGHPLEAFRAQIEQWGAGRSFLRGYAPADQGALSLLGGDAEEVLAKTIPCASTGKRRPTYGGRPGHGSRLRVSGSHL
jgi:hypothetical protein